MFKILNIFNLLFLVSFAQAQVTKGSLLIKNGTILTVTKGNMENADLLVENGKITKMGKGLVAPAGTQTIDATGKFIMPGIIDAHSHIGIDVVNEASRPSTADVWVGDALDPLDLSIYRALAGGVTASHAMHGSANAVGGECETIKHRYGTLNPEEMRMEGAPRTIKFALGENPMRVHGEGNRIVPATRMGVEQIFRKGFEDAKAYMAAMATNAQHQHSHEEHTGESLIAAARDALTASGEQWTAMREAVFADLAAHDRPVSAYDIADNLSAARGKRVAPNSIYRILDLFVANNLAMRVESSNAYLANSHPGCQHDCIFLVCDECGDATHVDDEATSRNVRALASARGFKPERPVLEIRGLCRQCA